jgi:DNA-directed RNA polymerase specialized sigma24 family protein
MANEWDHANREKRGGGKQMISLDEQDTELRYRAEPADEMSPGKAFERQWALTLLQEVLDRLSAEFSTPGKTRLFGELKVFLSGEKGGSYAEIGAKLGMTESAVKVTVHRRRHRHPWKSLMTWTMKSLIFSSSFETIRRNSVGSSR